MATDLPPVRPLRGEPMRCPSCDSRLVELERSGILIDACPQCRGLWLDRGELDRLLAAERRLAAGVADDDDEEFFAEMEGRRQPAERQPPSGAGHREGSDKKRRRKSSLLDLLDFD